MYKFGAHDLDLSRYIHNLETNIQSYLGSKDWNEGQRQEFTNAYNRYLSGLQDQLTNNSNRFSTNSVGTILDSSGEFSNTDNDDIDPVGSEYYYDNKGNKITTDDFNTLKKRKQKNYNTFSANREVATYFNAVGNALSKALAKQPQQQETSNKFNLAKHGFLADWKSKVYTADDGSFDATPFLDMDQVDESTGQRGTTNRAAYLKQQIDDYLSRLGDYDYSNTPFKDGDTFRSRLQEASEKLANGYNSEDTIALNAAGIGNDFLTGFFGSGSKPKSEYEKAQEDLARMAKEKQEQETIQERDRQFAELEKENYFNDYIANNPFKSTISGKADTLTYTPEAMHRHVVNKYNVDQADPVLFRNAVKQYIDFRQLSDMIRGKQSLNVNGKNTTTEHVFNNLDLAARNDLFELGVDSGWSPDNKAYRGFYYVPDSENYDNWSYIAYNPWTKQYEERSMLLNEQLKKRMAYTEYDKRKKAEKHQLGGTVGGSQEFLRNYQKELDQKKQKDKPKTKQEEGSKRVPSEDGFTSTDYARLASMALDIVSMGSAYVPVYGTAVSAGTGLVSSFTNFGADWAEDGLDWGDVGNLGTNIVMDIVGLIPGFGSAGKVGKITKNLIKYVPKILTIASAKNLFDENIHNSFKKVLSDEKLTTEDWKNIGTGLQTIAGLNRMGAAALKAKGFKNAAKTGDFTITNKSGKQLQVTPEQLEGIKSAKNIKDANAVLQSIKGYEGEELASHFKHGVKKATKLWDNDPIVRDHYDFSGKYQTRGGKTVDFYKPFSDASIFRASVEGQKFPKIRQINIKNPYNVSRVAPTTSSTPQAALNTPRYFRLLDKGLSREELIRRNIHKDGGVLDLSKVKKFKDGNLITGVKQNSGNWYSDIHLKFRDALADSLGKSSLTYQDINMMGDRHSQLYGNWRTKGDAYFGNDVQQYQTDINNQFSFINTNGINNGFITNRYGIPRGANTGDNPTKGFTADGRFSGITDDRRPLGREGDYTPEQLAETVTYWKSRNYNFMLDPNSKYYHIYPMEETPAPAVVGETTSKKDTDGKSNEKTPAQPGTTLNLQGNPTVVYGIPRAMYADRMNRKMTDMAKDAISPLLKDPFEVHRATRSDLDAEMQGERNYANLRRLASTPLTSDGSLQTATQLQAEVQGQEARTAGREKSNQVQRQYDEAAWQQEKENASNRHETAMYNRAQQWAAGQDKSKMEQAYTAQKFNIWDTLGQQFEYEARQKQLENKNLTDNFARSDIHDAVTYDPKNAGADLTPDELAAWNKVLAGTKPSSLEPEESNIYIRAAQKVSRAETGQLRKYYNIPITQWSNRRPRTSPHQIEIDREGGTLSAKNGSKIAVAGIKAKTADAERFQKQIKETIDRHQKALDRLSKSMYGLIKPSMIK